MKNPGENDDERARYENGSKAPRERKNTPLIFVGGPAAAADRLSQLQRTLGRLVDTCGSAERLVRSGGFTPEARAFLIELADHFENDLPSISAGTGRTLRRLADLR